MSAIAAISAAPPRAILIWSDGLSLYTELPGPAGQPTVIRYPLTASGLSQALGLIRTRTPDGLDRAYRPERQPPSAPAFPGTSAQRDNASAILRRLGMLR